MLKAYHPPPASAVVGGEVLVISDDRAAGCRALLEDARRRRVHGFTALDFPGNFLEFDKENNTIDYRSMMKYIMI